MTMNFETALAAHFPGAQSESSYIKRTGEVLKPYGFQPSNTIACVGVCRDELTRTLVEDIQKTWGEAFNFSSLAGMLFLGKTGFLAAHQHAPNGDGPERYAYFAFPHIGLDSQGTLGVCYRAGRKEPSHACGALLAFQQELPSNNELDLFQGPTPQFPRMSTLGDLRLLLFPC